jgi:peptide/nickel transport system permease protein
LIGLITKRLLLALPTLLVVSFIGFTLMRFDFTVGPIAVPGWVLLEKTRLKNPIDPLANLRTNPQISTAALKVETERLGLDKPFLTQYWLWLTHVLRFDLTAPLWAIWQPQLGKTFDGQPVEQVLLRRTGNSLLLNVVTLALVWLVALPLGIWAAVRHRGLVDRFLTLFGTVGMALPSFVLALMLAVWAVKTGALPVGSLTSDDVELLPWYGKLADMARHLALPVLVLSVGSLAGIQRQVRSNLLDVLGAEYIRTARAKGLPEHKVLYKHALRVAINPLITLMGFEFAGLLSGALLVETVLNFPGVGYTTYQAIQGADTNMVMAVLILSAFMLVVGNLLADILLMFSDPRIRQ